MASVAPTPVAGRDLWRRNRAPLIASTPAGVLLGAIADLAFSVNTVHASPQDQIPALLASASRAATSATQLWHIAVGAGSAVVIGVLLSGALSAASTDSWERYSFSAVIAVVTGLVAAAGASGITAFFQYRHRLLP